jgi:hypothetical protein
MASENMTAMKHLAINLLQSDKKTTFIYLENSVSPYFVMATDKGY